MNELLDRKVLLSNDVLKYVSYNKSLVLDGFVNFNLNDKNSEINSLLPTDTYSFTYHSTELDALNGISLSVLIIFSF